MNVIETLFIPRLSHFPLISERISFEAGKYTFYHGFIFSLHMHIYIIEMLYVFKVCTNAIIFDMSMCNLAFSLHVKLLRELHDTCTLVD